MAEINAKILSNNTKGVLKFIGIISLLVIAVSYALGIILGDISFFGGIISRVNSTIKAFSAAGSAVVLIACVVAGNTIYDKFFKK